MIIERCSFRVRSPLRLQHNYRIGDTVIHSHSLLERKQARRATQDLQELTNTTALHSAACTSAASIPSPQETIHDERRIYATDRKLFRRLRQALPPRRRDFHGVSDEVEASGNTPISKVELQDSLFGLADALLLFYHDAKA